MYEYIHRRLTVRWKLRRQIIKHYLWLWMGVTGLILPIWFEVPIVHSIGTIRGSSLDEQRE